MRTAVSMWMLAVVTAGCGRIGFDAVGATADAVDAAPLVIGQPRQITTDPGDDRFPQLTWTGSQLGLAWRQNPPAGSEIAFAHFTAAGDVLGRTVVSPLSGNDNPVMVWTGSEHTVAWLDDAGINTILQGRVGADGLEIGNEVQVISTGQDVFGPEIAWTGMELGMLWTQQAATVELHFDRLTVGGGHLSGTTVLGTTTAPYERTAVVWTGTEYVAAWTVLKLGVPQIVLTRIDASGARIGGDIAISPDGTPAANPSLIWTGAELALAWDNCPLDPFCIGGSRISLVRLDRLGATLTPIATLSTPGVFSTNPKILWTGGDYVMIWEEDSVEKFAHLAADGTLIGDPVTINTGALGIPTFVATSATSFALSVEVGTTTHDVYLQTLALP